MSFFGTKLTSRRGSAYPPLEEEDVLNHSDVPQSIDPILLQEIHDYHNHYHHNHQYYHQVQQQQQQQQQYQYNKRSVDGRISHSPPPPYNPDYVRKVAIALTCNTNYASSTQNRRSTSHTNDKEPSSSSPRTTSFTNTEASENNKEPSLTTDIKKASTSHVNKVQGTSPTTTSSSPPPVSATGETSSPSQQLLNDHRGVRDEPSMFHSRTSLGSSSSSSSTTTTITTISGSVEKTKQVAVKSYHAIQHTTVKASQRMTTLYQEIKERRPTVRRSTTSIYGITFSFRDR